MAYRNDLEALTARHDALSTEVEQRTRELEDAKRLLDEARAKTRLPVLDNIRVAAPCSEDWAQMSGDDRVRACGSCQNNVYNLSEMTRDEAQALILSHEGRLCVRYFRRHDGTILTADCPTGVKKLRKRRWIVAGATLTLIAGFLGVKARGKLTKSVTDRDIDHDVEMGKYAQGEMVMGGIEPSYPEPPQPQTSPVPQQQLLPASQHTIVETER